MSAANKEAFGGGSAAPAAEAGAEGASPRTVIRGESTPARAAIIDYLRFSFLPTCGAHENVDFINREAVFQLRDYLRLWFSLPLNFQPCEKGMFGYTTSEDVMVYANGEWLRIAIIATGGSSTGNTVMLDMSGHGCGMVTDWRAVYATLQDLDARITRVDLALDFMSGHTVDAFDAMYHAGEFNAGGRIPSRRFQEGGDYRDSSRDGKTLYVGRKQNGKELCVYEKGKQLGDPFSEWVRVEARFSNRDRVIPHDVLLNPSAYFAGAYKALEQFIDDMAVRIATESKEVREAITEEEKRLVIEKTKEHIRRQYGKAMHVLVKECDFDFQAVVESVAIVGVPRRLKRCMSVHAVQGAHDPVPTQGV